MGPSTKQLAEITGAIAIVMLPFYGPRISSISAFFAALNDSKIYFGIKYKEWKEVFEGRKI